MEVSVAYDHCQKISHTAVFDCLQHFVCQASLPDRVVRRCKVDENNASLESLLKALFDVVGEAEYLIRTTPSLPEASLLNRGLPLDHWADAVQDQSLQELKYH